jgi:hypothetical protein
VGGGSGGSADITRVGAVADDGAFAAGALDAVGSGAGGRDG